MKKGFTLVELLVVVAILGVLAAVGIVLFDGFLGRTKENASRANHKNFYNLVSSYALKCSMGNESIEYNDTKGIKGTLNCPANIDSFINIMNQHLYSSNIQNPYWGNNPPFPSWCKINVTNCDPPGYLTSCPTDIRMTGNMSIFKSSSTQITVCSNVGIENNNAILISNKIEY